MNNRLSRWSCLTIFAALNLVLWIVVATAVGLVASDVVDLGVETLIREGRVTAIALWYQVPTRISGAVGRSTAEAGPPIPAATRSLETTSAAVATPFPTPAPAQVSPTVAPARPAATPLPTEALLRSALLMTDPGLDGLMQLDAEMRRSDVGRPVQIRYGEAALNREIATLLDQYPNLPYRDVQVELGRDQITVEGTVDLLGVELNTEIMGIVQAEDCLPEVQIDTVALAGVLTPGFFRDQIKEIVLESLSWYPADYPLCLEQIVLEEGRVTVYASRR
jgi:hypothetical protein